MLERLQREDLNDLRSLQNLRKQLALTVNSLLVNVRLTKEAKDFLAILREIVDFQSL